MEREQGFYSWRQSAREAGRKVELGLLMRSPKSQAELTLLDWLQCYAAQNDCIFNERKINKEYR